MEKKSPLSFVLKYIIWDVLKWWSMTGDFQYLLLALDPGRWCPTFEWDSVCIKWISLESDIAGIFPGSWEQKPLNKILFWAVRFAVPRFSFKMLVFNSWLASPRRGETWLLWKGFDHGVIWSRIKELVPGAIICAACLLTPVLWTLCLL